jgi:hypothetical protein
MNENQSQLDRIEAKIDLLLSIIEQMDNDEQEDNQSMYGERDQTQPL